MIFLQDYAKKDLLILGGGDGALLHELLKEEPKFVTMVDIDEAVMRACKEHLRSTHTLCFRLLTYYPSIGPRVGMCWTNLRPKNTKLLQTMR